MSELIKDQIKSPKETIHDRLDDRLSDLLENIPSGLDIKSIDVEDSGEDKTIEEDTNEEPQNMASSDEFTASATSTASYDNFQSGTYSLKDGQLSPNQKWKALYTGFGKIEVRKSSTGNNYMYLQPKTSTSPSETHGGAVKTTTSYKDFDLSLSVKTIKQLRQNSPPNNWETAWVLWNAIDQFHAYGFTLKKVGFQLEKKDNNNRDDSAEIYLVTKTSPSVKMDTWQKWRIKVTGTSTGTPHIEIWIDGIKIVDYIDNKPNIPRNSLTMRQGGPIVLYTEDAAVAFDNVNIVRLQ